MVYEIIKPIKERVRFLTEHHNLFHGINRNNSDPTVSEKSSHSWIENNSQQLVEGHNSNQITTQSTISFSNNHQSDVSISDSSTNSIVTNEEAINSPKEDDNKENDGVDEESTFPNTYVIPDLPSKVQQIIQEGEIFEFRGHTNARRLLLDTIFTDITINYSLL